MTVTPAAAALEAVHLSKHFAPRSGLLSIFGAPAPVRAVDDVTMALAPGEVVALVGESGSGKTTLGRLLVRLEQPTSGRIVAGGVDMTRVRGSALKRLRRQVQLIFQNPYESLDPRHSVATAVTEPLRIHGIGSRSERSATARELLEAVGLAPAAAYLDRLPHELSGGQRQRVAIARAMALRPSVLVADEPVSMLDASIRSSVLNLMLDLRERFGIAILFVSHDLASARYMSKRALVMYRGQIVEEGPTDDVVATPAHPYTRMLIAASSRVLGPAPAVSRAADRPPACRFAPRCPLAQPVCWTDAPPMVAVAAGHAARCHFALDVLHGRGAPS